MTSNRLIISLTTIPSRFPRIGETLAALLAQTARVEEIRLIIPHRYRRFPKYDGALPNVPEGITIHRPEVDLGPASKVLFTAAAFQGQPDVQILFCDDDRAYSRDWAGKLSAIQTKRPAEAVALSGWDIDERLGLAAPANRQQPRMRLCQPADHRFDWPYRFARLRQQVALRSLNSPPLADKPPKRWVASAGYADVLEGWGGAIVRPQFFCSTDLKVPEAGLRSDDVWLSGALASRGIRIWVPRGLRAARTTTAHEKDALWALAVKEGDPERPNHLAVNLMRESFGVWPARSNPG